jgi:hypothetical protein
VPRRQTRPPCPHPDRTHAVKGVCWTCYNAPRRKHYAVGEAIRSAKKSATPDARARTNMLQRERYHLKGSR